MDIFQSSCVPGKVNLRAKLNWQWQRLSIFSNRGQPFCLSGLARAKMYTFLFASDNTPIILENCKLHPLLPSMNCRQHPIQFVESVNGFLFVKSVNSISVACNSLLWGSHLRRARYRNPDLPLCDMSHYCHIVAVTLCSLSMQTFKKENVKKTDGENLCVCKTVQSRSILESQCCISGHV